MRCSNHVSSPQVIQIIPLSCFRISAIRGFIYLNMQVRSGERTCTMEIECYVLECYDVVALIEILLQTRMTFIFIE